MCLYCLCLPSSRWCTCAHGTEKKRLQEADVAREREKQEGFAQSDRAHQDAIAELERVYERKLGQEAARNRAHRVQFQDLNMKLANELLLAKRHFAEEVAQLRAQFDREQAAHGADRKDLSGKLQLVEAEAIAMLEEQDEEHDHERQKNQSQWRGVSVGTASGLFALTRFAVRLSVTRCSFVSFFFSLSCALRTAIRFNSSCLCALRQTSTPRW